MKKFFLTGLAAMALTCLAAKTDGFVRVQGTGLVDAQGKPFFMRGVNLGHWLLPEGYQFGMGSCDSPRMIDECFRQLVGPEATDRFWQYYKDNFVTEKEIRYIAETGANTVRLPFHYKLFTEDDYLGSKRPEGFKYLDRTVEWCRRHGLKVILDMHCCPGGQTGENIDDSYGYTWLFTNKRYETQFCELWRDIAKRYANDPTVLGYDLMNEPISHRLPDHQELNKRLEGVMEAAGRSIRTVDRNHILIFAGAQWNGNLEVYHDFSFDENMMYSCHQYSYRSPVYDDARLTRFTVWRDNAGKPLYMGEFGHNDNGWLGAITASMAEKNIGWTSWNLKHPALKSGWLQAKLPDGWEETIGKFAKADRSSYEKIIKARPDQELVLKLMKEYLRNCRFENCARNSGYLETVGLKVPPAAQEKPRTAYDDLIPRPKIVAKPGSAVQPRIPERVKDQSYTLEVKADGTADIRAESDAGRKYAETTLAQLKALAGTNALPPRTIVDWPALKWRGMLNDCGRNYQSVDSIKKTLDLLAAYKLNYFHWHLTDYHGWRLESKVHPEVTAAASQLRQPGKFYTQAEFKEVVEYAVNLGITIMPELDVPGHTRALRKALGVEKLHSPGVDKIIVDLIDELCALEPGARMPFIHIGTDEVGAGDEQVPDEWYQLWANTVVKNGRTVLGWCPGHKLVAEASLAAKMSAPPVIASVWGQDSSAENTEYPYIDSTKSYYLNHVDPFEIARGAAYQRPCRWAADYDDPRAMGAEIDVWHDVCAPQAEDVWRDIAIAPGVVMLSDAFWGGREDNVPEYWSHPPEADDSRREVEIDLERRTARHRDFFFGEDSWYPFPFVMQTPLRWRMSDMASGAVIATDLAGATIAPRHWLFDKERVPGEGGVAALPTTNALAAKGTKGVTLETWIRSPKRQKVGAFISFTNYSRSLNRSVLQRAAGEGEWSTAGAKVFVNDVEVAPPKWRKPGQTGMNLETAFADEEFWMREPTELELREGVNHVKLVVPDPEENGVKGERWTATFVPVLGTSAHPREVPGLEYSSSAW